MFARDIEPIGKVLDGAHILEFGFDQANGFDDEGICAAVGSNVFGEGGDFAKEYIYQRYDIFSGVLRLRGAFFEDQSAPLLNRSCLGAIVDQAWK